MRIYRFRKLAGDYWKARSTTTSSFLGAAGPFPIRMDRLRIDLTARLGLLICYFAAWVANHSLGSSRPLDFIGEEVVRFHQMLSVEIAKLRRPHTPGESGANWDETWATFQTLEQIETALSAIGIRRGIPVL